MEHHDYIPYDRYLPSGPRILTVFIYLNDLPHDGGDGTHFPFHQHTALNIQSSEYDPQKTHKNISNTTKQQDSKTLNFHGGTK